MEDILPSLRDFIIHFCKEHKVGRKALSNLNLNTSLYPELNLEDLDIDLFLSDFVEKFKIDYSKFNWGKYGYPEGYFVIDILKLFGYHKLWVRKLADRIYKPKFFVRNLQEAILTGKLE